MTRETEERTRINWVEWMNNKRRGQKKKKPKKKLFDWSLFTVHLFVKQCFQLFNQHLSTYPIPLIRVVRFVICIHTFWSGELVFETIRKCFICKWFHFKQLALNVNERKISHSHWNGFDEGGCNKWKPKYQMEKWQKNRFSWNKVFNIFRSESNCHYYHRKTLRTFVSGKCAAIFNTDCGETFGYGFRILRQK